MAGPIEAIRLLDVEVDHVARRFVLVAPFGFGRIGLAQPRQPSLVQHSADRCRRHANLARHVLGRRPVLGRKAQAARGDDAGGDDSIGSAGRTTRPLGTIAQPRTPVLPPLRSGTAPASRPSRERSPHAARPMPLGVAPPSSPARASRTIRSRPPSVSQACSWTFVRRPDRKPGRATPVSQNQHQTNNRPRVRS